MRWEVERDMPPDEFDDWLVWFKLKDEEIEKYRSKLSRENQTGGKNKGKYMSI